jgi:non-ribosomal peptide synthetase component F
VFKTALTFVDSVAELWGPLLQGRSVLVVPRDVTRDPEQLLHMLEEQKVRPIASADQSLLGNKLCPYVHIILQVQRLVLVPSLLRSLLLVLGYEAHNKGLLNHLKMWVCSGEPLPTQLALDFFAHFDSGDHVLCNFYGSTEVMGDVTYHVLRSANEVKESAKVPIG